MPPPRLSHVLHSFRARVDQNRNLISYFEGLHLARNKIEMVTEIAFLRVFMAWEDFLEESFVRYVSGAVSPSGYKPKRLVSAVGVEAARLLLCGGRTRTYVRWYSASEVIDRVNAYFVDGGSYLPVIESITTDLDEMNTIRNRIAHESKISRGNFESLVRHKIGSGIKGMTPGRFLAGDTPKTKPKMRFFDHYSGILDNAGRMIIP